MEKRVRTCLALSVLTWALAGHSPAQAAPQNGETNLCAEGITGFIETLLKEAKTRHQGEW